MLAGGVGDDTHGNKLEEMLAQEGVDTSGVVVDAQRPTTHKLRVVSGAQQLLRLDWEERDVPSATIVDVLSNFVLTHLEEFDGVIFSDYCKGLFSPKLTQEWIHRAKEAGIPVVVDSKTTDYQIFAGATYLTPNRKELERVVGESLVGDDELKSALSMLVKEHQLEGILLTCGAEGIKLLQGDGKLDEIGTKAKEVFDVTGAGDTVTALFALGLARSLPAAQAAAVANLGAGVVVSKFGTATLTLKELEAALCEEERLSAGKVMERELLAQRLGTQRLLGRKIVFTNGCFDILHAGHVLLLQKAKALGELLVVGINTDASVKRLKGESRPVVSEDNRARVLAALDCVDFVTFFDEDTPKELVEELRPDVLVKGEDYRNKEVVGQKTVESYGGRVELIPLAEGLSKSHIIAAIKQNETE